mmetsp:Transcript_56309/g.93117  ORF Transcript_56309/g.93117 Transcript_56309/m.93117 type:complete len:308 (-) Transcript_56309:37-960(-)
MSCDDGFRLNYIRPRSPLHDWPQQTRKGSRYNDGANESREECYHRVASRGETHREHERKHADIPACVDECVGPRVVKGEGDGGEMGGHPQHNVVQHDTKEKPREAGHHSDREKRQLDAVKAVADHPRRICVTTSRVATGDRPEPAVLVVVKWRVDVDDEQGHRYREQQRGRYTRRRHTRLQIVDHESRIREEARVLSPRKRAVAIQIHGGDPQVHADAIRVAEIVKGATIKWNAVCFSERSEALAGCGDEGRKRFEFARIHSNRVPVHGCGGTDSIRVDLPPRRHHWQLPCSAGALPCFTYFLRRSC